jgi:glutaredoxin
MSITVEFFATPGCDRCAQAKAALRQVAQALGDQGVVWREADILEELDRAVDLGIVGASAVAVDGELMSPQLPKPEVLRKELLRRLANGPDGGASGD